MIGTLRRKLSLALEGLVATNIDEVIGFQLQSCRRTFREYEISRMRVACPADMNGTNHFLDIRVKRVFRVSAI